MNAVSLIWWTLYYRCWKTCFIIKRLSTSCFYSFKTIFYFCKYEEIGSISPNASPLHQNLKTFHERYLNPISVSKNPWKKQRQKSEIPPVFVIIHLSWYLQFTIAGYFGFICKIKLRLLSIFVNTFIHSHIHTFRDSTLNSFIQNLVMTILSNT